MARRQPHRCAAAGAMGERPASAAWLDATGPAPSGVTLLSHLVALLLVLRGLAWLACVPLLAAVLGICLLRQRRKSGSDDWAAAAFALQGAPPGSHAVAAAWLLGGLISANAETRLFCGVAFTRAPGLPRWVTVTGLALWLARAQAAGAGLGATALGPLLAFGLAIAGDAADAVGREQGAGAADAAGRTRLPTTVSREADGEPGGGLRPAFGFDRAVKCFPNWAPPTHKEVRSWIKAFSLREELLAVYACAVPAKLLHHGSLYISMGHVCYHGVAIITHSLNFKLPMEEIKEVRYGGSREAATLILKRPLLMKGRRDLVTSVELRGCEAGAAAITALVAGLEGVDEDEEPSDLEDETPSSPRQTPCPSAFFSDGDPFQTFFDVDVPRLQLAALAERLMADDWGPGVLILDKAAAQGATEVAVTPWIDDGTGGSEGDTPGLVIKIREVTMRLPCPPAPMCPRSTRVTTTYRITVSPTSVTTIESSAISHDVPFGDKFLVQERVELHPLPDGRGANAMLSGRVVFLKSCGMLQGRIKSSVIAGASRVGEQLVSLLNARAAGSEDHSETDSKAPKVTCTLTVWELQRRTTIMHSDWRAPFLPHDGKRRWRWVDTTYQKHPWITCVFREEAAAANTPPIDPRSGWSPLEDWEVQLEGGDCDGWQYASDFGMTDRFWSKSRTGHHVRRRLWTRVFEESGATLGDPRFSEASSNSSTPELPHGVSCRTSR